MDEAMLNRLRAHANMRPVAIPDTDGEVQGALATLGDLVAMVAPDHEEGAASGLDATVDSDVGDAIGRLAVAVRVAEAGSPAQPIASDGRDELTRIAWAHVEAADLIQLGLGIAEAARLHGLLSLPWDDTVSTLFAVLPPGAGRVVLDQGAHAAYERLVDRILGIWHAGDPLAPYLYRRGT